MIFPTFPFQVAIDSPNIAVEKRLLVKAEKLHKFALGLARQCFGEANVQTAKQYGNLGRLYQTTKMFKLSEKMHLKAIAIKEAKLGVSDYEVALSIGHLASLYNYDMKKYTEAEQLYLRSIAIGKNLFGPAYSGLEYDYLGLQEVQNTLFAFFARITSWCSGLPSHLQLCSCRGACRRSCTVESAQGPKGGGGRPGAGT